MRVTVLLLFLLIVLGLSSCGYTQIISEAPDAEIYADGYYLGRGTASITRTGFPERTHLEARRNGQVIGNASIRRSFRLITAIGGLYTYGLGFILFWKYPREVIIPVPYRWDESRPPSIWELPPGSVR
ncbi:MAG TPA: hypothetical protein P5550_10445 [Bacteroidales bacterium]|nr:hypothetical protein [Bacteroidales bacterium]